MYVWCVCNFDVCICLFVWGGMSETSFLLFLHLFFAGVLYMHMCFHVHVYSSLNMLTAIEGCLEQLFETIESLPADKVEAAEKVSQAQ